MVGAAHARTRGDEMKPENRIGMLQCWQCEMFQALEGLAGMGWCRMFGPRMWNDTVCRSAKPRMECAHIMQVEIKDFFKRDD